MSSALGSSPAPLATTDGPRLAEAEVARVREELRHCAQASEELQHRSRNTMALVRSVFNQTVETGETLDDVAMHFGGRLDVLARYMLPYAPAQDASISLEGLVRDELQGFRFGDLPGITIRGPSAGLNWMHAQSFALAIHELATNSLKFGALAVKEARLSVTWTLRGGSLAFVWDERGVPIVASAPVRRGFGQTYIEEALPYQIGAKTMFERRPGGMRCTIKLEANAAHRR